MQSGKIKPLYQPHNRHPQAKTGFRGFVDVFRSGITVIEKKKNFAAQPLSDDWQ